LALALNFSVKKYVWSGLRRNGAVDLKIFLQEKVMGPFLTMSFSAQLGVSLKSFQILRYVGPLMLGPLR